MERRNRIGEYVEEMLQMGKIVDENKKNQRKKRIAVIVMLVVIIVLIAGFWAFRNWAYCFGAIVFLYGISDFALIINYWKCYNNRTNKSAKTMAKIIVGYNFLWIVTLILFEKLLTKMKMKIVFRYFGAIIYSITFSMYISIVLVLAIFEKIYLMDMQGWDDNKNFYLRLIILIIAIAFVILYRIILKIGVLWLEKAEEKERRKKDIKEINEKLDTIGLSIAWILTIIINTIGEEKMGVIGSEVVVILGAFSTWVSLRNRWENSKE